MKQRTIYTCEKCGLEIEDDYAFMIDHEQGHIFPVYQRPEAGRYSLGGIYPRDVVVEMSDGTKVLYEYKNIVEEKESPPEAD